MALLNQEIWLSRLERDKWFQENPFMAHGVDLSAFVDNDRINFAQAGAPSNVTVNPTYPLQPTISGATQRTDNPGWMELKEYATDPRVVTDAEAVELSYGKLDSVVDQDKEALEDEIAQDCLYEVAPAANTPDTPIITAAGTAGLGTTDGRQIITKGDIKDLAYQFDILNYPTKGRVLVMSPAAFRELANSDQELLNQWAMNDRKGAISGKLLHIYSFDIIMQNSMPFYDAGLNKLAAGAAPTLGVDGEIALAYIDKKSWGKALGSVSMYHTDNDPFWQGDIVSFRKRAIAQPFFQKLLGGIVRI